MRKIQVAEFQPFESRQHDPRDKVRSLRFKYDPELIDQLKEAIGAHRWRFGRHTFPRCTPGGWLPEHKVWFVEREIYDEVRYELEWLGHEFDERLLTPECIRCLGVTPPVTRDTVMAAFRRLAQFHHPDHGGSAAAFRRLMAYREEALDLCGQ